MQRPPGPRLFQLTSRREQAPVAALSEYETASLAARCAGLAIGLAQFALIRAGIRLMRRDRGIAAPMTSAMPKPCATSKS